MLEKLLICEVLVNSRKRDSQYVQFTIAAMRPILTQSVGITGQIRKQRVL